MDGSGMQEDTWIFDLTTRMWECWYGSDPICTQDSSLNLPKSKYALQRIMSGPGPFAFPVVVQLDTVFLFGGVEMKERSCAELGRGKVGSMTLASNVVDMWTMDTSTLRFRKVALDPNPQANPQATALTAMVSPLQFTGYQQPLLLAGGADLSCLSLNPPCAFPTASGDIWIMDAARKESTTSDGPVDKV
jgi:hypothetical protein